MPKHLLTHQLFNFSRKELNYNHNYRSRSTHQKKSHSPPNSHKEKRGNAYRDNENKYIRDSSKYYRHDSRNKSPKKHKSTRKEDNSEEKKKYHHHEHKHHKNYDKKYVCLLSFLGRWFYKIIRSIMMNTISRRRNHLAPKAANLQRNRKWARKRGRIGPRMRAITNMKLGKSLSIDTRY